MLDEAGRQCDMTTLLDPLVGGSCSATFMEAGNYKRAMDYIRKDFSSEWSKAHGVDILVRQGRYEKALQVGAPQNEWTASYTMLLACVQHRPATEITALASQVQPNDDPEVSYFFAAHLAYCGQEEPALRMLDGAVQANYCSYPAIDIDPLFENVRGRPEFAEIHARAMACNRRFLSETKHYQKSAAFSWQLEHLLNSACPSRRQTSLAIQNDGPDCRSGP